MARIRSVKPEFWSDRALSRLSRDARLLYIALWNQSDEHGRLHGDPRFVKGHCLPYDDDLGLGDIDRLLGELERAGRVQRYEIDGDPYIYLPKLAAHQRLEAEKVPSRLPPPPEPVATPLSRGDNSSESRADESAPDADEKALLYVAGSRGQVAGSRGSAQIAPRADTAGLVAEFVDHCRERPPDKYLARIGKEIKSLVAEGVPEGSIRGGLVIVAERGLGPTVLPSAIHEYLNARPRERTDSQTAILQRAMQRAEAKEGGAA